MKNQNDLIWSIVAVFVLAVVFIGCLVSHPTPPSIPAPDNVVTSDPILPSATQPVFANALPTGSNNQGGAGPAMGMGMGRGGAGMGSPMAAGVSGGGGGGGAASRPSMAGVSGG